VEGIVKKLGGKAVGRDIQREDEGGTYALREEARAYLRVFEGKTEDLRPKSGPA
jgi:hypothetical protein